MNYCHNPPGPGGGQFCSDKSLGGELTGKKSGSYTPLRRTGSEQKKEEPKKKTGIEPAVKTVDGREFKLTVTDDLFFLPDEMNDPKGTQWVAKITGPDNRYRYRREYLRSYRHGNYKAYDVKYLEEGALYEMGAKDKRNRDIDRVVAVYENGQFREVEGEELNRKVIEAGKRYEEKMARDWDTWMNTRADKTYSRHREKSITTIQENTFSKMSDDDLREIYEMLRSEGLSRRTELLKE